MDDKETQHLTSISGVSSDEEIGEFWDTHSLADYWDQTHEVDIEVRIPRKYRVVIEAETYARISDESRRRGVLPETLINMWLAERLQNLTAGKRSGQRKKKATTKHQALAAAV